MAGLERLLSEWNPREDVLAVEDRDHYDVLHKAIIFDSLPAVQMILCHGRDVNRLRQRTCWHGKACPHAGLGYLHLAAYLGRRDAVKALLAWGADARLRGRVYTSSVLHCPADCQPRELGTSQSKDMTETLATCGERSPAFYCLLHDHSDVIDLFLPQSLCSLDQWDACRSLIPAACRIGAYHCLERLCQALPWAEQWRQLDADGLPPILMAMRHGLRFCNLLLREPADVQALDDLWEPGANILHFLFRGLPYKDHHVTNLCDVMERCLQLGANVNAQRGKRKATPLHDLVSAINAPVDGSLGQHLHDNDINTFDFIAAFDQAVIESVVRLVLAGADVTLVDSSGRSVLDQLVSNVNNVERCSWSDVDRVSVAHYMAVSARRYGMDNLVITAKFLFKSSPPPCDFYRDVLVSRAIQAICLSQSDRSGQQHGPLALERLTRPEILDGYCQLLTLALDHGFDPNSVPDHSQSTPLMELLIHAVCGPKTPSHASDGLYVISLPCAHALARLISVLVQHGARTEVAMCSRGYSLKSCFDILLLLLHRMLQVEPRREALEVLHCLILVLLQHGALPLVFQTLLFIDLDEGQRITSHPTQNLLVYQYLQFGAFNLTLTLGDGVYWGLYDVIAACTQQEALTAALTTTRLTFSAMHKPDTCRCRLCTTFRRRLEAAVAEVRSLLQLCRLSIRSALHAAGTAGLGGQAVHTLRLPTSLREFLMLGCD